MHPLYSGSHLCCKQNCDFNYLYGGPLRFVDDLSEIDSNAKEIY